MKGKLTVALIILVTIAVLILAWFLLEYVIVEFDVDRAMQVEEPLSGNLQSFLHL